MSSERPSGLEKDISIPKELASPGEANQYIGRKVCRLFRPEELRGNPAAWYIGEVIDVSFDDGVTFFKVVYEDGDDDELFWEEFREWAVVDKRREARSQSRAGAKGRTSSGAGGAHAHAASEQGGRAKQEPVPATLLRPGPVPRHQGEVHAADFDRQQRKRQTPPEDATAGGVGQATPHMPPGAEMEEDGADEHEHEQQADGGRPTARRRLNPSMEQQQQGAVPARAPPVIRRLIGSNVVMPAGHIDRIQLINFMCYRNGEIHFGKHVTFVAGKNGSGKSAMLQGLQTCLGAGARETGRGHNLGDWVNAEKDTARVILDIWNTVEGECEQPQFYGPFRHEIYGSMIRVERIIRADPLRPGAEHRSGRSIFKLYRADGKEVKGADLGGRTSNKEIKALADHFNIDTSNPLIVITQDKVKSFHDERKSGASCSKYDMYMSGTCMSDVRDQLAAAAQRLATAEGLLSTHHERLKAMLVEHKALEKRKQDLERANESKGLLADVQVAAVWASVAEAKDRLQQAKNETAVVPARAAGLRTELSVAKQELAELDALETARRDSLSQTRTNYEARLAELNRLLNTAKATVVSLRRQRDAATSQMRELQGNLEDLNEHLQEQQSKDALGKLREHQEKVAAVDAELTALQDCKRQAEAARAAALTAQQEASKALNGARSTCDAARRELLEARSRLTELQNEAGASSAAGHARVLERRLGQNQVRLVNAVARAPPGTFSRLPIGPIAMHLRRVADCPPEFEASLELALGPVLDAWIVNNGQDVLTLRRMAEGLRQPRPRVYMAPYRDVVHNYGSHAVLDAEGNRWRRVIDLVEPVDGLEAYVRATLINVLLDQAGAAMAVLVPDRSAGQAVALRQVPGLAERRITKAFDARFFTYEMRGTTMVTTPGYKPRYMRLAVDRSAELAEGRRSVEEREEELQAAEAAMLAVQAGQAEAKKQLDAAAHALRTLTNDIARCMTRKDNLEVEASGLDPEAASSQIVNNIRKTQQDMSNAAARISELDSQVNNATESYRQAAADLESHKQLVSQYASQREELANELRTLSARKAASVQHVEFVQTNLAQADADNRVCQQALAVCEREVDSRRQAALERSSEEEGKEALQRVREVLRADLTQRYPNKTSEQIAALLIARMSFKNLHDWENKIEAKVKKAEADASGDLAGISMRASAAAAAIRVHKTAVEAVTKKISAMREAQELRRNKYVTMRNHMDRLTSTKFHSYMARRNFVGSVRIDHDEGTLELVVRKGNEQHKASSMMQLSGGERSLTTASFLLAMGEVMATPFRAMDEYDVFMDTDRRKVVTMGLLECAWRFNPHSQLVLLSPQDTSILTESFNELVSKCQNRGEDALQPPPDDFMKVVILPDPRARAADDA